MAYKQKPQQTGKRPRGKPKKSLHKETTSKMVKIQETKTLEPAMRDSRQEGTCLSEDKDEGSVAAKKRTCKILSKKERESLIKHLNEVDPMVLTAVANSKLREQSYFSELLMSLVDGLFTDNYQLAEDIITNHQTHFSVLYVKCKQEVDSYLQFQLQWQQYCSAFLLSRTYPLIAINLEKSVEHSVAAIRLQWLDFCDRSGIPVPESNPVMITLSLAVYEQLLECTERFQRSLSCNRESVSTPPCSPVVTDGDDVHFRFGGDAICEMLHLRYKQIKGCTDTQRNKLSPEIVSCTGNDYEGQDKFALS